MYARVGERVGEEGREGKRWWKASDMNDVL